MAVAKSVRRDLCLMRRNHLVKKWCAQDGTEMPRTAELLALLREWGNE